jgi:hypothetical protein
LAEKRFEVMIVFEKGCEIVAEEKTEVLETVGGASDVRV